MTDSTEKGQRMAELDFSRITNPLRLAKGSHEEGSGKGCAMNVVSYVNGDTKITDYPSCSARPLARLVQTVNDVLARPDGYLSPENAVIVLDLGFSTMGTAGAPQSVVHAWYAELLDSPEWGVSRFATDKTLPSITAVADLLRRSAGGGSVYGTEWIIARRDAAAAADSYAAAAAAAAAHAAAYAAADSYVAADSYDAAAYAAADSYVAADSYDAAAVAAAYAAAHAAAADSYVVAAVAAAAADSYAAVAAAAYAAAHAAAHAAAYAAAVAAARVEHARMAIAAWRRLAKLDEVTVDVAEVDSALAKMTVKI